MSETKYRVTVLGDGGWGTAIAVVNARRKNDTLLWSAFPEYAKVLAEKHENIIGLNNIIGSRDVNFIFFFNCHNRRERTFNHKHFQTMIVSDS